MDHEGYVPWREWITLSQPDTRIEVTLDPAPSFEVLATGAVTEPTTGLRFVPIPAGCFQMGSPSSERGRDDDERQHRVCVESFRMATTEVTNRQFRLWKSAHDSGSWSGHNLNGDNQPVVQVSWEDATAYAEWLSRWTGRKFRLPTEAEWEYAARAGTTTRYWWGDQDPLCQTGRANGARFDDDDRCNGIGSAPVGTYEANPWGLYDVHGNVWEWTCSRWDEGYWGAEQRCVTKHQSGQRAYRGGSWGLPQHWLRSAVRSRNYPAGRNYALGFRLAEDL